MPRLLPSIVLLCLVSFPSLACRSAATLPPDGNRTQEDHAPTPFSAEEIRRACPQGRWNLFETAHPGKPRSYQLTTFTKVDEDGAELEAVNVDEEGERIGEVYRKSATWIELQGHASFPASATEIFVDECETPAGIRDCWLYVVRSREEGKEVIQRFWFARLKPGPPIHVERIEDGVLVAEMTLLDTGVDQEVGR